MKFIYQLWCACRPPELSCIWWQSTCCGEHRTSFQKSSFREIMKWMILNCFTQCDERKAILCVHQRGCWVYDLPEVKDPSVVGTFLGGFSSPGTFTSAWLHCRSGIYLCQEPLSSTGCSGIASSQVESLTELERVEWLTGHWAPLSSRCGHLFLWHTVPVCLFYLLPPSPSFPVFSLPPTPLHASQ